MLERVRRLSGVQLVLIAIGLIVVVGLIIQANDNPSRRSGDSGNGGGGGSQADTYVADYGGSLSVYQQILASSNCAALQTQFDTASDNHDRAEPGSDAARWSTGYMVAADRRMQAVGCY